MISVHSFEAVSFAGFDSICGFGPALVMSASIISNRLDLDSNYFRTVSFYILYFYIRCYASVPSRLTANMSRSLFELYSCRVLTSSILSNSLLRSLSTLIAFLIRCRERIYSNIQTYKHTHTHLSPILSYLRLV